MILNVYFYVEKNIERGCTNVESIRILSPDSIYILSEILW